MKFRTLKLLRRRRIARKRIKATEMGVQALIIFLALVLVLLAGCNTNVCPDKTTVEVGVTETDSKNDKLQEKKSITQTFKWGKSRCQDR